MHRLGASGLQFGGVQKNTQRLPVRPEQQLKPNLLTERLQVLVLTLLLSAMTVMMKSSCAMAMSRMA